MREKEEEEGEEEEEEEVVVEHNPLGWGGSSSEAGQSDGSAASVSMEEDPSRLARPAKSAPARRPAREAAVAATSAGLPVR